MPHRREVVLATQARRIIIAAMSWAVTLLSLAAAAALPPAPQSGIRDDAHVFSPAAEATLAREMQDFRRATGFRLFIDTNTFLDSGSSTSDRARTLLHEWNGDEPAAIICIARSSTTSPSIYVSEAIWQRATMLELMTSIRAASLALNKQPLTEVEVTEGARTLMKELTKMERIARSRDRLFHRRDAYLAAAFVAILGLGSTLAWGIIRLLRRNEAERAVQHLFPDVEVGQRFGATCGGGVIVEITYRK